MRSVEKVDLKSPSPVVGDAVCLRTRLRGISGEGRMGPVAHPRILPCIDNNSYKEIMLY